MIGDCEYMHMMNNMIVKPKHITYTYPNFINTPSFFKLSSLLFLYSFSHSTIACGLWYTTKINLDFSSYGRRRFRHQCRRRRVRSEDNSDCYYFMYHGCHRGSHVRLRRRCFRFFLNPLLLFFSLVDFIIIYFLRKKTVSSWSTV